MSYIKLEKMLQSALEKLREGKGANIGVISADLLYKSLDPNKQRKVRKQMVVDFLRRKGVKAVDLVDVEEDHTPTPSGSSSVSDEMSKEDMDVDFVNDVPEVVKKAVKSRPPTPSPNRKSALDIEPRETSRRTIKRRKVFDPSDYAQRARKQQKGNDVPSSPDSQTPIRDRLPKPSKTPTTSSQSSSSPPITAEELSQLDDLCYVCGDEISVLPPDTKPVEPQTCTGCQKAQAHGACVSWELQPWKCDKCRTCSMCHGKQGVKEPIVTCRLCKDTCHQKCISLPSSRASEDWFCNACAFAFSDDVPTIKETSVQDKLPAPVAREKRKSSNGSARSAQKPEPEEPAIAAIATDDDDIPDEIPDCSEWTPEQVHSYFQMFVPSQDAQVFLDQEIDGRSLQLLQRHEVLSGFKLTLGAALKVYAQVKRLQEKSWDIGICWP